MSNIKTINVDFISGTGEGTILNLRDANNDVENVNITRVTQDTSATVSEMDVNATNLSVSNSTNGGAITFSHQEEVLTASTDVLDLSIDSVRTDTLTLNEAGDGDADTGFYFETVNVTTSGINDIDGMTIAANSREAVIAGAAVDQAVNITANGTASTGRLEINDLTANGAETIEIVANARVEIADDNEADLAVGNDGISTADLSELTISGAANVMIDGLDGDDAMITVDASAMTGNLKLGVAESTSGGASSAWATRADVDLSVTSGSGDDEIALYAGLAGDVTTNDGDDSVTVTGSVEGVSTVSTGAGDDSFSADDLAATVADDDQSGNDAYSVNAADVTTGAGDDTVVVDDLQMNADWDNNELDDSENDDRFHNVAASIDTGEGDDAVTFGTMAENAVIMTGAGNDTVSTNQDTDATKLAADTDANVGTLRTEDLPNGTREVTEMEDQDTADLLGAHISLGDGDDTIQMTDASSRDVTAAGRDVASAVTLVGQDALVEGGLGDDTMSVTTLDSVTVVDVTSTAASMADQDTVDATSTAITFDIDDNVTGIETLNLTINDQIVNSGVVNVAPTVGALAANTANTYDITFAARYDIGDTVTVTVAGIANTVTVAAGATTGADVAAAMEVLIDADAAAINGADGDFANAAGTADAVGAVLSIVENGAGDGALTITSAITNALAPNAAGNDNDDTDGAITADILRFDSDLATINLTSNEKVALTAPNTEVYVPGTSTTFTLHNIEAQTINLTAYEATGVTAGAILDDTVLAISATTGAITGSSAADADVTLNLDYADMRGDTDARSLTITATQAFDLDLNLNSTRTDVTDTDGNGNSAVGAGAGNLASTTDNDTMQVENFTITFTDALSHSVDMNAFGDADFAGENAAAHLVADTAADTVTSLTVNSDGAAGTSIDVDAVNADTITFADAAGTGEIAANVTLRVDAANSYRITTGTGSDIIDARLDDVRADDNATAYDRADYITASTGRDTLIIGGDDSLGSNGTLAAGADADETDDDVFETITGIERILIDTADSTSADQEIVLDEAADITGVDTIKLLGTAAQTTNLLIGNNFTVKTTADNANGETTSADSALVIDASLHTGATTLNIQSDDTDQDIDLVNMDVRVDSDGGAAVTFRNTGDTDAVTQLTVYTADEDDALTLGSGNAGNATELVDVNVTAGSIDKIIILEGQNANNGVAGAGGAEDALANNTVIIEDDWTGTAFELDASAVLDTDRDLDGNGAVTTAEAAAALLTGGLTITVEAGDTAALTIRGTQNNDSIISGGGADTIFGNAGDDTITGDEIVLNTQVTNVAFAATYDALDTVAISAGGETATFTINADGRTGAELEADIVLLLGGNAAANGTTVAYSTNRAGFIGQMTAAAGAGASVDLTGAAVGTGYAVTATTDNSADDTAQVQTLTVTDGSADGFDVQLVFNGVTYSIDENFVAAASALETAITAIDATATLAYAAGVLTITGGTSGAAFPLITQAVFAVPADDTGALAVTAATLGTDQANPTVATTTDAITVVGGADTIDGGSGDDTIEGLAGADILTGGTNTTTGDTVTYANSKVGVTVNLALATAQGGAGDAAGDVLTGFENVTGSAFADTLTGDASANTINGGAGNDTLNGAAGIDTITGGAGNDTISGGAGNDVINLDTGTDVVVFAATASANGADSISNFTTGTDTLNVDAFLDGTVKVYSETASNALADGNVQVMTDGTVGAGGAGVAMTAAELATKVAAYATLIAADAAVTESTGLIVFDDTVNTYVYYASDLSNNGSETLVATLVGIADAATLGTADFVFG